MSTIQRGGRGDNAAARKCEGNRIIVESICIANVHARPRGAILNPSGVSCHFLRYTKLSGVIVSRENLFRKG